MLRVGLTGGIAAGKSTASECFRRLGAVVIDYDVLARAAVAPGSPVLQEIARRFGPTILTDDGELDRAGLATRIFADARARAEVDNLIHPQVYELAAEVEKEAVARDRDAIVIHDIPLLVEKGLAERFATVVVVEANAETRLDRLAKTRGLTHAAAEARIAAGATDAERQAVATYLLNGNGTPEMLCDQVRSCWIRLTKHESGRAGYQASKSPVVSGPTATSGFDSSLPMR